MGIFSKLTEKFTRTTELQTAIARMKHCNRQNNFKQTVNEFMKINQNNKNQLNNQGDLQVAESLFNHALKNINNQKHYQYQNQPNNNSFFNKALKVGLLSWAIYYIYTETDLLDQTKGDQKESDSSSSNSIMKALMGSNDEIEMQKNVKTRFSDVQGIDEFKDELQDIVEFLKNPQKYIEAGAKLPKGILLTGPPGTGKTLMARALAGESNCSFFYKSGSEFDEMFVGLGASRIRQLFEKARQNTPAIIFIDEIDSIAGKRNFNENRHSRDTINQILTEMDGFKESDNIIIIGATNFQSSLDKAILRPGRFDKTIQVPLPDVRGRQNIFDLYLKDIQHTTIDSEVLAKTTTGFTGADIQNMVNVAILQAIRQGRDIAEQNDFEFAKDRIRMGIGRKSLTISEKDKMVTAYHEVGHALTSLLTKGSTPLHKVTILPRGGALGFTSYVPNSDQQVSMSARNYISQIDVAMGGRAAEDIFFGDKEISSGSGSDLQKATQLAYQYVMQFGMNEDFSLMALNEKGQASDKYQYSVDQEVNKMLKESYGRVRDNLILNRDVVENIAMELLKKETMSAQEVQAFMQN